MAIDLAGWLNDINMVVQAIVQCYGLVVPFIFFGIDYEPVVMVSTNYIQIAIFK